MHFNKFPWVRNVIRKSFRAVGLDLIRYNFHNSEDALLKKTLEQFEIDLVIDVGANAGQYGSLLRDLGYKNKIYSFEPIAEVFSKLQMRAAKDGNWEVFNKGIGSKNESLFINVSENFVSSSLLPITDASTTAKSDTKFTRQEEISIITLDSFFERNEIKNWKHPFLKIDVQGYEKQVLDGSLNTLKNISVLQIELSLVKLYEGSMLYKEVIYLMEEYGFYLYTIIPGFRNPQTGQLLQIDGVFVNKHIASDNRFIFTIK
jgi:FkbM family methyltransferase